MTDVVVASDPPIELAPLRQRIEHDARTVAAGASSGAAVGFVVGGIGSRLAMLLLARLNPEATGRVSDDGFLIGQFNFGNTFGLLVAGTILGAVGGLVFVAIRSLRFGPPWFRTASMTFGPAVVIGSALVHSDGVDFVILDPAWLAIALFVLLPGVAAFGMLWIEDRWLDEDSWFFRSRRAWAATLLLLAPLFLLVVPIALGIAMHQLWLHAGDDRPELGRAVRGLGRAGLTVVFLLAGADLARDVLTLT